MNDTYVRYLEAKRDELLAQLKLMTTQLYYKDSVIRRLKAENELIQSEQRQPTIERFPDGFHQTAAACPDHSKADGPH